MAEDGAKELVNKLPDLVLGEGIDIRVADVPEAQLQKKELEDAGYLLEKDLATGDFVAKKRIIIKGNKS